MKPAELTNSQKHQEKEKEEKHNFLTVI